MSIVTVQLKDKIASAVRDSVQSLLGGTVDAGAVSISLPDSIMFKVERKPDHVSVEWDNNPEVELPGIDPDLIRARLYQNEAEIDLVLSGIRITY